MGALGGTGDVSKLMGLYGFAAGTVMEAWRSVDAKKGPNTGFVASLRPIAHSTALATASGFVMQYTREQVFEMRGANPALDDDELTWFAAGVTGGATFLGGGYLFGGGAFFKSPYYIPGAVVPKGALMCGVGMALVRALWGGTLREADHEWRAAKRNPQFNARLMARNMGNLPDDVLFNKAPRSQADLDALKGWFEENHSFMSPSYRVALERDIARAETEIRSLSSAPSSSSST